MGFGDNGLDGTLEAKREELNMFAQYLSGKNSVKFSQMVRGALPEITGGKLNIDELEDSQVDRLYDRLKPVYNKLKAEELAGGRGRMF